MSSRGRVVAFLGVNLLAVSIVAGACQIVTDNYIEERRRTTIQYENHGFTRFRLKPEQIHYRGKSKFFNVGEHRLRGEAPQMPKPKDELRIFAIGGSSVFDHLKPGKSWPEELGEKLAQSTQKQIRAYNGGVPGYSSREALAQFQNQIRYYQSDYVLIYQGWNDAKYMEPFLDGIDLDAQYPSRDWKEKYAFLNADWPERNYRALLRLWADRKLGKGLSERAAVKLNQQAPKSVEAWLTTPGMNYWRENMRRFVYLVRETGAQPVIVAQNTLTVPDLDEAIRKKKIIYKFVGVGHQSLVSLNEAMVQAQREVAKELEVPFFDLRSQINGKVEYFSDHVHLTKKGSDAWSTVLAKAMTPLFTSTATASKR